VLREHRDDPRPLRRRPPPPGDDWGYRPLVATARDEVFPAPPYPANTLVVVQGLAEPHFLVEIEGIAVLD
jgi:enamine deaminase RidA (YjgF/YER057c/UK114 family)